jgi:hypothetical protein
VFHVLLDIVGNVVDLPAGALSRSFGMSAVTACDEGAEGEHE